MTADAPARIHDVAARAQVSTATVSRYLNMPDKVRGATAEKIKAAIAELSYTPHFGGRVLAMNRTKTVGAIIPTMDNAIFARGLQAMQEALADQGLVLLVASSNYDPDQEFQQIRALINRGVESLVLIGTHRAEGAYEFMQSRKIPFVIAWAYEAELGYPCVGFDNYEAARSLAQLVLSRGIKDVAMIAGKSKDNDRAQLRIAGVKAELEAVGGNLPTNRLIECDYDFNSAAMAFEQFLSADNLPEAIICGNDVLATGVLMAAKRHGIRVPEQVSVVGFDDIDLSEAVSPPLTTVHVPHRKMGRLVAQTLIAMVEGKSLQPLAPLETHIVERASLRSA